MIKLENLELVEVTYENDDKKVVLTFLDEEAGEIRNVNFNKQSYKDNKYVDDPEKAAKVDEWCQTYFNCKFEELTKCIGVKKDVYAYDTYSSLWESEEVNKFTSDMKGNIYYSEIKDILVDDYFIKIRFELEGKLYESKFTYGMYNENLKKWFKDPVKKLKKYEEFKEKFGVPVEKKDTLIGTEIIVEVKCAFNKFYYAEIKQMPKKGK